MKLISKSDAALIACALEFYTRRFAARLPGERTHAHKLAQRIMLDPDTRGESQCVRDLFYPDAAPQGLPMPRRYFGDGGGRKMKANPTMSALKLEPQHFDEFAEQLAAGLPFVLTDGTRRIELVPGVSQYSKERVN